MSRVEPLPCKIRRLSSLAPESAPWSTLSFARATPRESKAKREELLLPIGAALVHLCRLGGESSNVIRLGGEWVGSSNADESDGGNESERDGLNVVSLMILSSKRSMEDNHRVWRCV